MHRTHRSSRRALTAAAVAVALLAPAAPILLPTAPAHAAEAEEGFTAPAGTMIIAVVVPERSSTGDGSTPGATTAPRDEAQAGPLAVTGLDATALWVAALAAAGAVALGGGAVALSRRRARR